MYYYLLLTCHPPLPFYILLFLRYHLFFFSSSHQEIDGKRNDRNYAKPWKLNNTLLNKCVTEDTRKKLVSQIK